MGPIPDLKPKSVNLNQSERSLNTPTNPFSESLIHIRKVTDLDKDKFLQLNFLELKSLFRQLFEQLQAQDTSIEYVYEEISSYKILYKVYQNGSEITGLKMWIGTQFGRGIHLLFGSRIDAFKADSINDGIICAVDEVIS
nr:hypothetical protein [Neobacillus sp. Marseille-Q6967]